MVILTYSNKIKKIEAGLATGEYGYANGHENRVTFKNYIDRSTMVLNFEKDAERYYNSNSENQDVGNLLIMTCQFFNLPDFISDKAKFMLDKTWNNIRKHHQH